MLNLVDITHRFGKQPLFEKINVSLDRGKRYGLIGANGAGKSTLIKIVSKEIEVSSGEIKIEPGLKMGVLGQNQFAFEEFTLKDAVLYGNKKLFDANKEKEKLYEAGDFSDEVNERLNTLEMICCEEDPTYECDVNIEKLLSGLGFKEEEYNLKMSEIKSGDKVKILLAQVLFPKPDILLLDEPTNNLDLTSIGWLENELKKHEGVVLIISHDRHFLNSIVTNILDLDFKTLRSFTGTYDDWYMASTLIKKQQEMSRAKAMKEKDELEAFVRRFSANASKAKQATSRQKKLDKLDVSEIKISTRRDPVIHFNMNREAGNEILELSQVSKSYSDDIVFKDFNFKIEKGDKIALLGSNGVGKSTLLKILQEEVRPENGEVKWGQTIQSSYFPQDTTEVIQGDYKLYEWIQGFNKDWHIDDIRKALGRMLFNGDAQEKEVGSLSGGEKHRMMLSKIMMENSNVLLLDEPDNHLDLEAIISLGEAMYNFKGNIVCATHDRDLIQSFANRIIYIDENRNVTDFSGNYEEFLNSK